MTPLKDNLMFINVIASLAMCEACMWISAHLKKFSSSKDPSPHQHFWTWFLKNAICCVWRVNTNCCLEINSRLKSSLSALPGREIELLLDRTSCLCPLQKILEGSTPPKMRLQTFKFQLLHQTTVSLLTKAACSFA